MIEKSDGLVVAEVDGHGHIVRLDVDTSNLTSRKVREIEVAVVEALAEAENCAATMRREVRDELMS